MKLHWRPAHILYKTITCMKIAYACVQKLTDSKQNVSENVNKGFLNLAKHIDILMSSVSQRWEQSINISYCF